MLTFVCKNNYPDLRPVPGGGGSRIATELPEPVNSAKADQISTYPNPAHHGISVKYFSQSEAPALLEVKDLLGKTIYTNFISNENEHYIPLASFGNGIYFISISRNKEIIYKTKIVKQD